jgi:hypothetical protein
MWLVFFVLILLLIESFFRVKDKDGITLLIPEDRTACWEPVRNLYFPYLGAIIAFWFIRPLPAPKTDEAVKQRFYLALIFSVLFNLIIVYFIAQVYLSGIQNSNIVADIKTAVKVGAWFSFIVGPVITFYFGSKQPG